MDGRHELAGVAAGDDATRGKNPKIKRNMNQAHQTKAYAHAKLLVPVPTIKVGRNTADGEIIGDKIWETDETNESVLLSRNSHTQKQQGDSMKIHDHSIKPNRALNTNLTSGHGSGDGNMTATQKSTKIWKTDEGDGCTYSRRGCWQRRGRDEHGDQWR